MTKKPNNRRLTDLGHQAAVEVAPLKKPEEPIMFDLSKLEVKETSLLHLEGPDGELLYAESGEPVTVTVYGPGSKQFQKAQSARNRAVLELVRKGGKKVRDDEQRRLDADLLVACTASFNNLTYKDLIGHDLITSIYNEPALGFIAEQVNKQINDWSNFTPGSDKT